MAKIRLPKIELKREDYWRVGGVYIWKWIVLTALAGLGCLVVSVFGLPSLRPGESAPPAYSYRDARLAKISGLVRILDEAGRVRYEGEVDAGACTGHGKIYDAGGILTYDGPLEDGVCQGADAKVYTNGELVYTGEMAQNLYEGEGREFSGGSLLREGTFAGGMLNGAGREYRQGALVREGTFAGGLLEGAGREYGGGVLVREGTFAAGRLEGDGMEYGAGGGIRYEGQFRRGLYHGQGKLYDPASGALCYEGQFILGRAAGPGKIFHPSGQMLYEGEVYDGLPRADAFLGLSLAEVEGAFAEHWQLYSCGGVTAFVYPYFQLLFITKSPVELISPSGEDARTRQEREELLEAISDAAAREAVEGSLSTAPPPEASGSAPEASAAPVETRKVMDAALSPETEKGELVICEVLSWGRALPGAAQPDYNAASGLHLPDWREWFSACAAGAQPEGAGVCQTGPFVYEFTPSLSRVFPPVEEYTALEGGVRTMTVLRSDKDETLWYQSAVREDEP